MATTDNSCFWLVNFFKSSSLKLLSQMNQNLVGRVYGKSFINIAHSTKFRFIWQSGCRGEDFIEIDQSEIRIACGGHVC
jgi:hypothetical protein